VARSTLPIRALAARTAWFTYWNLMRRYHRFEARGLEHLDRQRGSSLIVGYHGRPIAHDLCMLMALMRERKGPEPRPIIHSTARELPVLRWLVEGVGFVTGDGEALAQAISRGDHVLVTPGGTREGCRSSLERYRVSWGERLGYLHLALKYKLPVVPSASIGVDDTYLGLNDGYRWGKRLKVPGRLPLWLGVGPLGLWPFSPPFPARITLRLGEPIHLEAEGPVDPGDRERLLGLHRKVVSAVQGLLDSARAERRARRARWFSSRL
jgi:1-acyl-sn-glycerol-3-phosphate acyltransferase